MSAISDGRQLLAGSWHAFGDSPPVSMSSLPLERYDNLGARIAVDPDRNRHLLVPTGLARRAWTEIASPVRDCVRTLTFGDSTRAYLDVRCDESQLFDVFDELIVDVLDAVSDAPDPGESVDVALARWRAMFRAIAGTRFGRARRFGLFAELLVLERAVAISGSDALKHWTGPSGGSHDFELPRACLEVKAAGAESAYITIHGFAQLDQDRDVPLDLVVYILAESAGGRTIGELISAIEVELGSGALQAHLGMLGYGTSTLDDRLSVIDSFAVRVDERIPALSSRTVAAGVREQIRRVDYDLSVADLSLLKDARSTAAVVSGAA